MFTAARADAPTDRRRSATALLLSLALNASIGGVLFSMRAEAAPVTAPDAALTYVELTVPRVAAGQAPSPAAPSKQPVRSGAKPLTQQITQPVTQLITQPAPPQLAVVDLNQAAALTVGTGPVTAAPTGLGVGPGTGIGDGPRTGQGTGGGPDAADGIREVDFSEMRVRYQFAPRYPEGALAQQLGEAICTVRLDVDTRGRPAAAKVSGCPEAFAVTAKDAAMQWRFAPLMDHRTAVPGRFVIRFRFHPE